MYIQEKLQIDDLHYNLRFNQYDFAFYLQNPPRHVLQINYRKHPEMVLFRDDPIYEDLAVNLPALKILTAISQRLEQIIYKHKINYWTFTSTSLKKANVYEKLLQRWLQRTSIPFRYDRDGLNFYIYVIN